MTQQAIPFSSFELVFFFTIIISSLFIDLYSSKSPKEHLFRKSVLSSIFWILLALSFNLYIFYAHGAKAGTDFATGYLVEKSLSIDNLFVFILIFKEFEIPINLQHRTLFYGMFSALIFRVIMIYAGAELLTRCTWLTYPFGLFLILIGYKSLMKKNKETSKMRVYFIEKLKTYIPVTNNLYNEHFFIKKDKKWFATPLFLTLICIEGSDLVFAVDSIPAILSITQEPYILITSNIFALLGLRSLYFAIQPLLSSFQYLQYGVASILIFVGIKLLIAPFYHISASISLLIISILVLLSVGCSYIKKR